MYIHVYIYIYWLVVWNMNDIYICGFIRWEHDIYICG